MEFLSQIFLKGSISPTELKKLSATSSPIENVVKALTGQKSEASLQNLNLSLLKNYLPEKMPLAKAFDNLIKFLSSLPKSDLAPQTKGALLTTLKSLIPPGEKVDENLLKSFIQKTGLNYEADIKKLVMSEPGDKAQSKQMASKLKESIQTSLKGQLLKVVQELETKLGNIQQKTSPNQVKQLQTLLNSFKATLSNVELNQVLNFFSKQEDGFLQFQIPFSQTETVDLYIKNNTKQNKHKESGEKEDVSLIFHMNLEKMGHVRIDVQVIDKSISARFYVEDKNVSQVISSMLPELEKKLKDLYNVSHLSSVVREKKFFEEEILEKKLFMKKNQIINVEA